MIRRPPRSTLLSLHDALPILFWPWITAGDSGKVSVIWYQTEPQDGQPDLDCQTGHVHAMEASLLGANGKKDRKSTRLNSSHSQISYAVFCLKKKRRKRQTSMK